MTNLESRRYGRRVLFLLLAFFGVMLASDITLVWFATQTRPGVVTADAYTRGLAYNQTLQKVAAQEQLGWQAELSLRDGHVVLALNHQTTPLTGAQGFVRAQRPTSDDTRTLPLAEVRPGVYETTTPLPPGAWDTTASVTWHSTPFQHSQRLLRP